MTIESITQDILDFSRENNFESLAYHCKHIIKFFDEITNVIDREQPMHGNRILKDLSRIMRMTDRFRIALPYGHEHYESLATYLDILEEELYSVEELLGENISLMVFKHLLFLDEN